MAYHKYIRHHGTSYYLANILFPSHLQDEVSTLYAMVRVIDDIVDDLATDDVTAAAQIKRYREFYMSPTKQSPILEAQILIDTKQLAAKYNRPEEWMESFFDAMLADTHHKRYETYRDLQKYMHGSAEVIGLMMCELIGYDESQKDKVHHAACLLGEAMQYTNFLRDIQEDFSDYDRIYMPHDRLAPYGLAHEDIIKLSQGNPIDDRWRSFVQAEISHCHQLYAQAESGIALLKPQGRRAVRVASKLYAGILNRIQHIDYDMFSRDAHTGIRSKTKILFSALRSYHVNP